VDSPSVQIARHLTLGRTLAPPTDTHVGRAGYLREPVFDDSGEPEEPEPDPPSGSFLIHFR